MDTNKGSNLFKHAHFSLTDLGVHHKVPIEAGLCKAPRCFVKPLWRKGFAKPVGASLGLHKVLIESELCKAAIEKALCKVLKQKELCSHI